MAVSPDQLEMRGIQLVQEVCNRNGCIYARPWGDCDAGATPQKVVEMLDGKGCGAAAVVGLPDRNTVRIGIMHNDGFSPSKFVTSYRAHSGKIKPSPQGVLFFQDLVYSNEELVT